MKDGALSIAMVSDFFHPDVGGVESHIFMLSSNLIRKGHKVIVITHSHPPDRVGIRWLLPSLKVYHIPFPTIASSATLPNYFTFLPYFRTIIVREHINLIHAHASLSSLGHEAILHSHFFGVRTVFTDHSLFGFEDAASILTNKLLAAALKNVDAVICVSHTGRENTVLRGQLFEASEDNPSLSAVRPSVYTIPNSLVAEQFTPSPQPLPSDTINIVVISRLAYRKGIDLLVATAPRVCAAFPNVKFIVGGDGPKLNDLLQSFLGSIRHRDVRDVLIRGSIFLNTSLTESFGIAILEAACTGLYIVSTRVGGVPEILPEDMISFTNPDEDDLFWAISEAIQIISEGKHNPQDAHERVKGFYDWMQVAERTETVYRSVMQSKPIDLWARIQRTMSLGPFAGPIYTAILFVDCLFFMDLDHVHVHWEPEVFGKLVASMN
ncbi:glycosyltransferase family 4 protein [Pisolithus microcarpus]|nr:glycosyltransferase family 4 protein [Pisolithus microcarpus]